MTHRDIEALRRLTQFEDLVDYLRDELDWPIEVEDADDLTFDYSPEELGIDPHHAVKIECIKQFRPLTDGQPWGIFFVQFESKRLPIVVMRRILRALVPKSRGRDPDRPVWRMENLLFISVFGDGAVDGREIAFAHFRQDAGDLPTLRVLGWDGADTPLKLDHVAATLRQRLCWPDDPKDIDTWREAWSGAFRHRVGHVIRTADALAGRLAVLARGIRDAALTLMGHETEQGPLRRMHKAFQAALIHDLSEADFADTYAQTITYGLLTAAISRTDMTGGRYGTDLIAQDLTEMVPITNPFLREMLSTFLHVGERQGGIDFDELGIQDVVELLRGDETDLPAILRDFGNKTRGEDPVIHFYETFLSAYDKELKVRRGIFYTPQPVVSYLVRSAHELLQTEFGLADGLASTVTWGEMAQRHPELEIPAGTDPASHFVVVLDPTTGTATFLVEVIDVIHRTLKAKWQAQGLSAAQQRAAWNAYVPQHLLPRLYGYELMMAPYAIAHMKIALKLTETGFSAWAELGDADRVRIYLTNALEPASDGGAQLEFAEWAPALAHEALAVNTVKRGQRFTVVVGNPPYSNFGQMNRIPFILDLLEDYKRGLNEKKLNLDDDFIKFVRFSHHLLDESRTGVFGMITNNVFIDGLTHRKMRESLTSFFCRLSILNLHGSAKKQETAPDGSRDENVFDIQQGVSVMVSAKTPRNGQKSVDYSELWGTRAYKYSELQETSLASTTWSRLRPESPHWFLLPLAFPLQAEYEKLTAVDVVFDISQGGISTDRDDLFFDFDRAALKSRMVEFFKRAYNDEFRARYRVFPSSSYDIEAARDRASFSESNIRLCLYRPFDTRWLYYDYGLTSRPARKVMEHMIAGQNIAMACLRQSRKGEEGAFFVGTGLMNKNPVSLFDIATIFPLWLYERQLGLDPRIRTTAADGSVGRRPNLRAEFLQSLGAKLQLSNQEGSDSRGSPAPEQAFFYIYAIVHSPAYRTRYAELLKIDFPRVPLTSSLPLFRALATLGADLVALHLLKDDYPAASWNQQAMASPLQQPITTFVERKTGTKMGKFSKSTCYDPDGGIVYLDTSNRKTSSYFEGVPGDVWDFHIGGYQVCYKWLYDRREVGKQPGRVLTQEDIAHYQRIVVALKETIRLMEEIDEVIEEHGGWPIQ